MSEKKRILILVDWFYPGYKAGGPIQSCVNICLALKDRYDIKVITTDTDFDEKEPYQNIRSNEWVSSLDEKIAVYYFEKKSLTAGALKKLVQQTETDYIYLNHMFSPLFVIYPVWLRFLGKIKAQLVLCPRGGLYANSLAVKPFKKKIFINVFRWLGLHKLVVFHATNEREKDAITHFFPGSLVQIANNLVKMNQPAPAFISKEKGVLKCIYISRILPLKNLLYLLQILQNVNNKIGLTIIGPVENEAYWELCQQTIRKLPDNISVTYKGPVHNDMLVPVLQEHHLFILPTSGENFGHSIFEAFLSGIPVLISDQTPWKNLNADKVGWDLPLDDTTKFQNAIETAAGWSQETFNEWAKAAWQYAAKYINNPQLIEQYALLFP
ncbi:MAG TPA: glycosyltransferase [Panacibacter sp.]|nr:glycosyltransferase [Panacibacter sp.]